MCGALMRGKMWGGGPGYCFANGAGADLIGSVESMGRCGVAAMKSRKSPSVTTW